MRFEHISFILFVSCLSAGATVPTEAELSPSTTSLLPRETSPANPSLLKGFLKLETDEYINAGETYFRSGAQGSNVSTTLALANDLRLSPTGTARLALSDQYSVSERWNYLNVNEAYVTYHQGDAHLSAGRKLDNWAEWEKTWKQGVFEPRYTQNRMHPEMAGLTGVFFSNHNGPWAVTVGALPINIPEFGPHFSVQDDKFVSPNPWFQAPASEFRYQNVNTELHYSLQQPRLSDIVEKAGAIAKSEYHSGAWLGRVTYAYKPAPQLAIGFPSDGLYQLPDYPKITIHPRVIYDRVANADVVYERGRVSASASLGYDNPEDDKGPAAWTSQVVSPAWIYSGHVALQLEDSGPHAARVEAGFLKVLGGYARDSGGLADDRSKFDRRFQYYEAYLVGYQREFRLGLASPFGTQVRVIYDRMQRGGVFNLNLGYPLSKSWRADFGLDLLGLLDDGQAPIRDGFLSVFRANDRVGLGVSYVF